MTRFHQRPRANGLDDASGGERRRQALHHRAEMAAALLIPGVVVGLPLLTNYGSAMTAGAATSRPASQTVTDPATVTDAGSALIAPEDQTGDPAVDGLLANADASFWDIYKEVGGLLAVGLAPVAPAPPGLLSTPTTLAIPTPAVGPIPRLTPLPTTPTTTLPNRVATVPRPPTNLVVDFDSPSLTTHWDAVTTNTDGTGFADFRTYQVSFSAAGRSKMYETTSPSFTYTFEQNGLDFGTPQAELTVTIRAVAETGSRSESLAGVATNDVPSTPMEAPLLVAGSASITVTLPDQGPVNDLAGFEIYELDPSTGDFVLLTSTAGSDAFIHDVSSGTTHHYVYKIRDVFGQVSPGFSPTATATAS